nr:MAG TPA: tail collar fiber protein [Caudoviricetes sp.]
MSEYNKTILTNAGIDLARRANKGAATFQLTRGVSSTENLSEKTIEELQNLTQLPSIQQSVSLSDVVDTTDNPDTVLGIRMTFDNQNLNTGYNVHTVGVYAKEPGKGEILYGVATAKTPEYIPDFREQMLFKFDFLMYLVIGRTDKVTVQVSPDDVYLKKDTYNKAEIDAKVSDAVSKLNDKDAEILKNLNDYKQENKTYHQNLEQQLDTKADKSAVNQQLETKADKSTTYTKDEVDNIISPKADKSYVDGELSKKADKATTYTKDEVNNKIAGQVKSVNGHRADSNGEVTLPKLKATTLISYDVANKSGTLDENAGFDSNGNFSRRPVDQLVIGQLADAINAKLPIEAGAADDDLCHLTSSKISFWNGNGENVKNLPPMNNKEWYFAIRLVGPGGWGSVTVIDQDGTYWLNTKNGDIWTGWRSVTTNETLKKLKFVKQSVNQNGNTFQDTKFVTQEADGTFKINIYDSDWTARKVSWLLKNTQSYNISANTDLNDIKAPGLYHCSGTSNIVNVPGGEDNWFNMVVNSDNWNGSQAFYATNSNQLYIRTWNSTAFTAWRRVINDSDYNNLLPLSGGNMNKGSWITWSGSSANSAKDGHLGGIQWTGATDNIKIFGDNNKADNLDLAIQLGDDNSNRISIRDKDGAEVAAIWANGHYTGTTDWNNVINRPDINNANPTVTVINSFDVANVTEGPHQTWPVKQPWLVDQMALHPFAEAINALNTNLSTLRTELMNLKRRVDYNSPQGSFSNTTVNINDLRSTGIYRLANCYIQNGPYPTNNAHWIYVKVTVFDENTVYQTLYEGDNMYGRKSSSPTNWDKWYKYLNQAV